MFMSELSLSHIMKIEVYGSIRPYEQDEDTALQLVRAGGHSNYVLHMSKRHFEALFLNKECGSLCLLV